MRDLEATDCKSLWTPPPWAVLLPGRGPKVEKEHRTFVRMRAFFTISTAYSHVTCPSSMTNKCLAPLALGQFLTGDSL
jgi:hypothetical protein